MPYQTFKKGTTTKKSNIHRCYGATLSMGTWQSSDDSVKQPQPTKRLNLGSV